MQLRCYVQAAVEGPNGGFGVEQREQELFHHAISGCLKVHHFVDRKLEILVLLVLGKSLQTLISCYC